MRVIESNEVLPGPEDQKDFWEGEQFQVRAVQEGAFIFEDPTGLHGGL